MWTLHFTPLGFTLCRVEELPIIYIFKVQEKLCYNNKNVPADLPQLQPGRGEPDDGEGGEDGVLPAGQDGLAPGQRPLRLPLLRGGGRQRDGARDQK